MPPGRFCDQCGAAIVKRRSAVDAALDAKAREVLLARQFNRTQRELWARTSKP